jgi:lipopolysaccharide transport system permease protein
MVIDNAGPKIGDTPGRLPDFAALARYSAVALVLMFVGHAWFRRTQQGFADVA